MKSNFIILLSLILSSLCLRAQEPNKEKMKIPIEFSLSLNRTAVIDGNIENRFGCGGGVYLRFFNQKRFHLVTGIEYNRNALFIEYQNTDKWGGGNYNTTHTLNNIGIPVSFRVNMGKKAIFFIEAGVFFDLAIFGREKGTYKVVLNNPIDSTATKVDRSFNENISYKMPNFGLLGGIGLRIPIQKWEIILKGDYRWGIRNLNTESGDIYNRYWRFSVGFKIPFEI